MDEQHKSTIRSKIVYVGNLHYSTTEKDVIELFQTCGQPIKVNYCWHMSGPKKGHPLGCAFVEYSTEDDAEHAISKLNNKIFRNRPLRVNYKTNKSSILSSENSEGVIEKRSRENDDNSSINITDIDYKIRAIKVHACILTINI
jgi:RNA recognition motif-containing protein